MIESIAGNRVDKTSKKPYDPAQFTEKPNPSNAVQLQEKIKLLEMDYKTLHDKRLQDVRGKFIHSPILSRSVVTQ